jgi:hypothetical protein
VTGGEAALKRSSASAGFTMSSRSEPNPATASPAETAPRRAASTRSSPMLSPAARPPQKASPAPVTSATGPADTPTRAGRAEERR